MPKFHVTVPHEEERHLVVQRLQSFSVDVKQQSPIELTEIREEWDEDGNLSFEFTAMNMTISGDMVIEHAQVIVAGKMPLAAAMFRGAIESQIAERIQQAIASATDPE